MSAPAGAPLETAAVDGLTHAGEGVVHGGKTVFVPGALPGERIRFRRTRRHRQHDDGELLEVLEASPLRIEPRCPHFGVCGGCVLQHLSPQAQLAAKEQELRDTLSRVARVAPARWLAPLEGPPWGYRRRARLGAKYVHRKGTVVVGFRERAAPYVAQLHSCAVLASPAGDLIAPLAAMLTGLSIREQLPQIEVAVAENATALVLRVLRPPSAEDTARLAAFAAAHRLRLYLQPGGLESVHPLSPGEAPLHYALPRFDVQLQFAPTDFIQVNGPVNEALVSRAVELLEPSPAAEVLDLYCGLGNFTLPLARRAARVVGVEGDAALLERARDNAQRNGIANAEFHCADLGAPHEATPHEATPAWARGRYSHVLLDPPRTGARAVLATVARLAPQRLLYISCHPGSLARDVGVLVHEHGLTLVAAGVVDMFPHTAHIESLALLTADSSPGAESPA
ncbi:MAG TPA: 23S rRNA (uracil(1939)-C(5))-methyltransferase RlmD [Steroidobacteraceae bacterium]|nr:23S rRNA (uracil(1939)-C(5))-methyltransferase RlmD [Steroidobacteraceae bacterium]